MNGLFRFKSIFNGNKEDKGPSAPKKGPSAPKKFWAVCRRGYRDEWEIVHVSFDNVAPALVVGDVVIQYQEIAKHLLKDLEPKWEGYE